MLTTLATATSSPEVGVWLARATEQAWPDAGWWPGVGVQGVGGCRGRGDQLARKGGIALIDC